MQLWNYFTFNYIGHPLGVRDKCFCHCKRKESPFKLSSPFIKAEENYFLNTVSDFKEC